MTATDEMCQMLLVLKLHALILGPDTTLHYSSFLDCHM